MSDINEQLASISTKTEVLKNNKVTRIAFTEAAYNGDIADGVENYNYANEQNIPLASRIELNPTIVSKGFRGNSASIPRPFMNHFFGRVAYNLNKAIDFLKVVIDSELKLNKLAGRYSPTEGYELNDVCSMLVTVAGKTQVMYFIRVTSTPTVLTGVPPLTDGVLNENWEEALSYKLTGDSPALTGTPTAPTAATSTNTTQIATTAFVMATIGAQRPYSTSTPLADGTGSAGSSNDVSRGNHRHPSDSTKANLASPALTGTPTAPTAAVGTNTTQIATTAFVVAEITNRRPYSTSTPLADGTGSAGSSNDVSRGNHQHPSDSTKANLASPAFTGTPTAPTQGEADDSTKIATTAFVKRHFLNNSVFYRTYKADNAGVNTTYTIPDAPIGATLIFRGILYDIDDNAEWSRFMSPSNGIYLTLAGYYRKYSDATGSQGYSNNHAGWSLVDGSDTNILLTASTELCRVTYSTGDSPRKDSIELFWMAIRIT